MVSKNKIFALIDCNNFYASCERVFNPSLKNKPVIVLSNNDGCVIARSNEAKALNIPMAAPFFKYKKLMADNQVHVFSSNYTYYGNMSDRVMRSIAMLVPDMEVYSIDESFFRLDNMLEKDVTNFCSDVRNKINQWLSIPTSIGIAPTKTLAKIANHVAKKTPNGVFDLRDANVQKSILSTLPLKEIWGISTGSSDKLHKIGINNALSLRDADSKLVRKVLGVVGERIVYELRGVSCLEIQEIERKKNIMTSRSFGRKITTKIEMKEAISNYVVRACQKLNAQKSKAQGIYVFVQTNPFNLTDTQHNKGVTRSFLSPTNSTKDIMSSALNIIDEIFVESVSYKKAGIMLLDLVESNFQGSLFDSVTTKKDERNSKVEKLMSNINVSIGKDSIFYASQGIKRNWEMQSNNRSKEYTTNLNELAEVF